MIGSSDDPETNITLWWLRADFLRFHRNAFIAVNGMLTIVNVVIGGGWWAFWPLSVWGVVFFLHLCFVRAVYVDDEWVNDRTDDLRTKSYDLSHIDDIDGRYNTGARLSVTRRAQRTQAPIEYRYPIVDAHHHFWDLERNYHPWLRDEPIVEGRHGDYRAIRSTYLPDHFKRDWGALNVVASVHVEAEWDPADEVGETRWLHELHQAHGFPSAVVAHAKLTADDVATVLVRHREYPLVRGIRDKPVAAPSADALKRGTPGSMSDPKWRAGFALLEQHGLSFDLQTPYWHLPEAAELAGEFPRTLIIVNHTGLPAERDAKGVAAWHEAMVAAACAPNIVVKISGLGAPHLMPWTRNEHLEVVLDTIATFGVERCMFGSNYPVDRLYESYETIMRDFMEMSRSFTVKERRALFHDNARHYYRIES